MATDGEQQQRELEEIRRSFLEIGNRMGPLFEPAQKNGRDAEEAPAEAPEQPPRPRRLRLAAAAVAVACLLVGLGLGAALAGGSGDDRPTPTSIVTQVVPKPETKVVAPPDCLRAVQSGDETIDLLMRKQRTRRLSLALKAYTQASQACRKEASP
jgi:hypothetical protein